MLMSMSYDVLESLVISLVFDDESTKKAKISVGDVVSITYNKNAKRETIIGTVKRIYPDEYHSHPRDHITHCGCHPERKWRLILDGSNCGASSQEKIDVDTLLDIDVLSREDDNIAVVSPVGDSNVSSIRVSAGYLQISVDNGVTWIPVVKLPESAIEITGCNSDLASKINSLLPPNASADEKLKLANGILSIVNDENNCKCKSEVTVKEDKKCNCDTESSEETPEEKKDKEYTAEEEEMMRKDAEIKALKNQIKDLAKRVEKYHGVEPAGTSTGDPDDSSAATETDGTTTYPSYGYDDSDSDDPLAP